MNIPKYFAKGLSVIQENSIAYDFIESEEEAIKIAEACNRFSEINGRDHNYFYEIEPLIHD